MARKNVGRFQTLLKEEAASEKQRPYIRGLNAEAAGLRKNEPVDVDDVHQDEPEAHHLKPTKVQFLDARDQEEERRDEVPEDQ